MARYRISLTEKLTLGLLFIILAIGYILFYTNLPAFVIYVEEDGTVEWLTVLGLILACGVCVGRFFRLFKKRNWWFLTIVFGLALLMFFGAGEEISWGQRILGIKSSAFFEHNNSQHETNFHNLIVDGIKVNKLIFSTLLSIFLGVYLLIFPILYEKNRKIALFFNRSAVPIPRLYQIISFVLLFIITSLLQHEKRAELLECGTALLFFLIIRYPKNTEAFDPSNSLSSQR
jgi:hypothetical protein